MPSLSLGCVAGDHTPSYEAGFVVVNLLGVASPVGDGWWPLWEHMSDVMGRFEQCGRMYVAVLWWWEKRLAVGRSSIWLRRKCYRMYRHDEGTTGPNYRFVEWRWTSYSTCLYHTGASALCTVIVRTWSASWQRSARYHDFVYMPVISILLFRFLQLHQYTIQDRQSRRPQYAKTISSMLAE